MPRLSPALALALAGIGAATVSWVKDLAGHRGDTGTAPSEQCFPQQSDDAAVAPRPPDRSLSRSAAPRQAGGCSAMAPMLAFPGRCPVAGSPLVAMGGDLRLWLVAGVLGLNVLVGLLGAAFLQSTHQAAQDRAATATRNIAQLVERDVSATLDRVGVSLNSVALHLEHQLAGQGIDRQTLWSVVDNQVALTPEASSIGIFDAHGDRVCAAPMLRCLALNVADRDYFQRAQGTAGTLLSAPIRSWVDQQWSLVLSRALRRRDGAFAGVVTAIVPLTNIQRGFASLDLGRHGAISLRHESLTLLARHPGPMRMDQEVDNRRVSTQLAAALTAHPAGGSYNAPTAIDGIERTNAYRKFEKYPLYIIVGLGTTDYMAAWHNNVKATLAFGVLFAGLTVAMAAFIRAAVRRRTVGESRVRVILESVAEGVVFHDASGCVVDCNTTAARMMGLQRKQLIGMTGMDPTWQVVHADHSPVTAESHPVSTTLRTGQPVQQQLLGMRLPGQDAALRWFSVNTRPLVAPGSSAVAGAVASLADVTEQITAQARIREQEALFRGMFDQSIFLAGILDEHGQVLELNARALQMLGLSMAQARLLPFALLPCWAGSPDLQRLHAVLAAARQGRPGSFETRHPVHGGGTIDVLFNAMPEQVCGGLRIAVVGVDITDRLAARAALELSERRMTLASDAGQVGIWDLDLATGQAWRSATHARIFGHADATGEWGLEHLLAQVVADDRERVRQAISAASERGDRRYEYRIRIRRPDGALRWLEVRGGLFCGAGGRATRLMGSVMDITERRDQEDELRLKNEIILNMQEGVCLVQACSRSIVYANPKFEAMFGYDPSELLGKNARVLIAPGEKPLEVLDDEITGALVKQGSWHGDLRNVRRDGSAFWCHATVSTFQHRVHGSVWVSVHQDVSDRKLAEEQLAASNALLGSLAVRDPLTCLFNRRHLDEVTRLRMSEALRSGVPVSVLMLDLDHFKQINDHAGHSAGDSVLAAVGKALMASARDGDVACRYGGEEFVLVLPGASAQSAAVRAEQIRARIEALVVPFEQHTLHVTVSVGVASWPGDGNSVDELIRRADRALYAAKQSGRNRVHAADPSM